MAVYPPPFFGAIDGQPPPLNRPPQTEQELRRLIDHLADPEAFARWLEWAMNYSDPEEE
mgnify:CR=1 FL=1